MPPRFTTPLPAGLNPSKLPTVALAASVTSDTATETRQGQG